MKRFAALYARLDATTKTTAKVAALADYFAAAPPADAAWALWHLLGERPKRLIPSARLRAWAASVAGIPEWLFGECYEAVGDLAETIGLLVGDSRAEPSSANDTPLSVWIEERLLPLGDLDEEAQRSALLAVWAELGDSERFLWNKLVTGAFRVGVSKGLVLQALARVTGVAAPTLAHRLMGTWTPTAANFLALIHGDQRDADSSRPYPFQLAHALEVGPDELGDPELWQAEWKWDGIRVQLVHRGNTTALWSRGEELVTARFPEVVGAAANLPVGTVVDGELLAVRGGEILPFALLQRRMGRTKLTQAIQREVPVGLLAFDLLEVGGADIRAWPQFERRRALEKLFAGLGPGQSREHGTEHLRLAPLLEGDWSTLAATRLEARATRAEGLMLKRRDAPYGVGRVRGSWWKWKTDPFTVDAVLLYAQRGHGRRASLYSDYTFAVWDGDVLVPFAKAYSGLTDGEIKEVDRFVRRNSREKFGPVRSVVPELVFELAFEAIQTSTRHKSGAAVRFPRIVRWRRDKKAAQADSLEVVRGLGSREE